MRLELWQLDTTDATDADTLVYDAALDEWVPGTTSSGVESIVEGPGVNVDDTDPAHPIISATGAGELLMADSVTSPPVPIETEAGDDWLYQD